MQDIDDRIYSSHSYYEALKFPRPGYTATGHVVDAWFRPKFKFGTEEVEVDNDGNVVEEMVLNLAVTSKGGDDLDVPELHTLYCKYSMQQAIFDAVRQAEGKLSDKGTLTLTRGEDREPKQKGWQPAHTYTAKYVPGQAYKHADSADQVQQDVEGPEEDLSWLDE